jgi:hypothetical protein
MSANIPHEEAETLGGFRRPINISFFAMTMGELQTVYPVLLQAPELQTVIGSLDAFFFCDPIEGYTLLEEPWFHFLFALKPSLKNFWKKLMLFHAWWLHRAAISILMCKMYLRFFPDIPSSYWLSDCVYDFRENCSARYCKERRRQLRLARPRLLEIVSFLKTHSLEEINERFNTIPRCFDYVFELVAQRPNVTFHFFIPPYSALMWICGKEVRTSQKRSFYAWATLAHYIGGLLYVLDKIEAFPNIHLYAFDDVAEITGNMANYMNKSHYGIGVNRYILRSLKAGKRRITKANVLAYLRRMAEVLVSFDPTPNYAHTVSFEGPLNEETEKAFATFPPPMGPEPLLP